MNSRLISLLIPAILMTACGKAPDMPRNVSASVELLDGKDEVRFHLLPLKAEVSSKNILWSGNPWEKNRGGINLRWNTPTPEGFYYESPGKEELLFMTPEQIASLSPSEKFDLLTGRYEYPLKEEVSTFIDPRASDSEKLDIGWVQATVHHVEPAPKTLINPDGLAITFGSSDIKALLSYHYQYYHELEHLGQLGRQCPQGSSWFNWNKDCKNDLNAGSFHVVLANRVNRHETFMVDIERFKEVKNRPVLGYVSRVEEESQNVSNTPLGTAKVLTVRTKVSYMDYAVAPSMEVTKNTPYQRIIVRDYKYKLFVGPSSQIVGGEWISEDRPDFLWTPVKTKAFRGLLEGLEKLLND